jgi:malonyl-CoA decarboxylase
MFERLKEAQRTRDDRRVLKRFLDDCKRLLTERGEANSVAIAKDALVRYATLSAEAKTEFFNLLANEFDPDPGEVLMLAERYAVSRSPENLIALVRAAEPPRQELLRRLNRAQGAAGLIVNMRADLLTRLKSKPALKAVDADFEHLLASWFNPGFLRLERIDWGASARLLEQIIAHEAVHEIDGWNDLRRRLEPDRRCFAFFHPTLPQEPLIFVEVALVNEMSAAIAPLLDRSSDKKVESREVEKAKVAVFYSISNCQPGLKGVSLGNFLIKRVAEQLKAEFTKLKTFCTLSPIPGFAEWLSATHKIKATDQLEDEKLRTLCAEYLSTNPLNEGALVDPVARFHLNNGARLERININADLSKKGLRQSRGVMVNYLYDLDAIEINHEKFVNGEVTTSRSVRNLL